MIRTAIILLLALTLPANAQLQRWEPKQLTLSDHLYRLCIFCTIPVGDPPLPAMPRESGDIESKAPESGFGPQSHFRTGFDPFQSKSIARRFAGGRMLRRRPSD